MMRKKGGGDEWRMVKNTEALESENDSYIDDLEARVQGLKEVRDVQHFYNFQVLNSTVCFTSIKV